MYKLVLELSNYTLLQSKNNLNKFCRHDLTIAWYPEGGQSDPDLVSSVVIRGCIFRRNEKSGEYEWVGPHVKSGIRRTYYEIVAASPALKNRILDEILKQPWAAQVGANFTPRVCEKLDDQPPIRMEL